jgi:APA family basic amino acid/polyamine antiporter
VQVVVSQHASPPATNVTPGSVPYGADHHRVIGAVGATGMIVAAMIGSGIFALTGQFGASVGTTTNVLAPWVIGGVLALCGGLALAELGAMIPCSGGSVEFARRAFGSTVGYLVAMVTILSGYFLSIAAVALLFAQYVDELVPQDLSDHTIAVVTIVIAYLSQLPGLRVGYAFNTALSVLKIAFVAIFVVAGLLVPVGERRTAPPPTDAPSLFSPAVASATLTVSFAYLGWSTGADIAGDIRKPGRNIPRAIIASILLVFALYLGVNLVYLRVIDPTAMLTAEGKELPAIGSVAARLLFGESIGLVMTGVIALLFFSTIVSGTITAARILESMAASREIPAWTGVRRSDGVPARALLVTLIASVIPLAIGSLDEIFGLLTVLVNIFSSLSVAAVIVLRRTMPDAPRPFRVPLYPFVPLLYLALAGWSIIASIQNGGWTSIIASACTVVGLLLLRPLLSPRDIAQKAL